jgi:pectate lyase
MSSTLGGSTPTGGNFALGGATAVGGSAAAGGAQTTGGTISGVGGSSTGGAPATGGSKNAGGSTATGGTKSTGGASATGGATGGTPATGGMLATGGTSSSGCSAPPAPSTLVGWASVSGNGTTTTTGGGNTTPVTVTTLAELQNAAKGTNAAVIYVKGVLATGTVTVGSNKTIAGICGAEIHGHVEMSGSVNVIVRNIKVVGYGVGNCALDPSYSSSVGCSSGNDAITVQNSAHHLWFDHCDISDGTDGNLDITKAADYITVSWTKFHYTPRTDNSGSDSTGASGHRYSNLIGGSDTEASAGKLNITWHHNWWADNVYERQPQVRFGKNHLFNNLWTSSGDNYCIRAVIDAHIFIDYNVFSGVKDPHLFYTNANATSNIAASTTNNTYTNTTGSRLTGGSGAAYTPAYSYTPDATAQVQSMVTSGAGPQ